MTVLQKWVSWLVGLGAGYMVLANPNAFYKATQGVKNLTAGSVVSITTGGKR
jgi:hypothetical protein